VGYIKQLAGQTMVYGFGIVIPRLLNYLLLTPFYTRVFDQPQYGVITELYAYVVFLLVILTYGMETGFFRFADKNHNKDDVYKTSLISLFSTSLIFILITWLFTNPVSEIIGYENHPEYIRWIAIIVAIDAFTAIPFSRMRLENKALKYSIIRIAEVSVNILANWFFLYYCPSRYESSEFLYWIYNPNIGVGYVFISNLIASLTKILLLLPYTFNFKGHFDFSLLKRMLFYSYPLLIAGLAGTVNEALDRVLLKHLTPENAMAKLGIYGANYKLAVLMTLFVQMFRYAAEPFFFNKKDDVNARVIYAEVMSYFVFSGMLIFMLVMLFLPYFALFIGPDFREGIGIVPIILIANLFMGIFYNLSVWYKITGQTKYGALFVIIGAVVTIMINVLLIPEYGYVASAWGHFVSYSLMMILCYLYGQKYYSIPYNLKRILLFLIVPVILILINKYTFTNKSILSIVINITFLLLYLLLFIKVQRIKIKSLWK
jgi:O-antigen/teichoic acid export membrane protein